MQALAHVSLYNAFHALTTSSMEQSERPERITSAMLDRIGSLLRVSKGSLLACATALYTAAASIAAICETVRRSS